MPSPRRCFTRRSEVTVAWLFLSFGREGLIAAGRSDEEVTPAIRSGGNLQAVELRPSSMRRQAKSGFLELSSQHRSPTLREQARAQLNGALSRDLLPEVSGAMDHDQTKLHLSQLSDEAKRIEQVMGGIHMTDTMKHMSDAVHSSWSVAALMKKYKDELIKLHKGGLGLTDNLYEFHKGVGKEVASALKNADFESLEKDLAEYYERQISNGKYARDPVGGDSETYNGNMATDHAMNHETLSSGLSGFTTKERDAG